MPRAEHFGAGLGRELLALPRPEASASVDGYCQLRPSRNTSATDVDGPLAPGDYGFVMEDTGMGQRPYRVQELESGHIWWYPESALQSVPADRVPERLRQPGLPGDGSYVTLMHNYRDYSDAGRGPLGLMRTENAFGMIIITSGNRFRVRACHPAGERSEWWYDKEALRKVSMCHVPEPLRDPLRPGWGDYVVLTPDHTQFGGAADGPLEEGNLGVVVAVNPVPDSQGGLRIPRYMVRACHNGLLHSYLEGAVHPVVLQLLHEEKVPPDSLEGRVSKLVCQLTLTEAGGCSGSSSSGSSSPATLPRVSVRHQSPGEGVLHTDTAQVVVPGKRYWVRARLTCKDDDLMLASFKPCCWELYAPTGQPGEYRLLKPVPARQLQQQRQPYPWQQQHQQQQLCPDQLPLSACAVVTKRPSASRAAATAATSVGEAAVGGFVTAADGADGADAGGGPWYKPHEDELVGVFEWDSLDTPLVLRPGGVSAVQFVWCMAFKDLAGQTSKRETVHLQITRDTAATAAALAAAAAVDSSHSSRGPTVMFNWLRQPPGPGEAQQPGANTPPGNAGAGGNRSSSSSGSSSSGSSSHGDEEDEANEADGGAADGAAGGDQAGGTGGGGDQEETDHQGASSNRGAGGHEGNGHSHAGGHTGGGGAGGGGGGQGPADDPQGRDADAGTGSGAGGAAGGGSSGGRGSCVIAAADTEQQHSEAAEAGHGSSISSSSIRQPGSFSRDESRSGNVPHGSSARALPLASSSPAAAAASGEACELTRSHSGLTAADVSSSSNGPSSSVTAAVVQGEAGGSTRSSSSAPATAAPVVREQDHTTPTSPASIPSRPASASSRGSTSTSSSSSSSTRQPGAASSSGSGSSTPSVPRSWYSSSTSTASSSRSGFARGASSSSSSARPPVVVVPGQRATPQGSRTASIDQVMQQLERQAESRQPFWQEGTEAAAEFAAKAFEAAAEWQQYWRRPGRM